MIRVLYACSSVLFVGCTLALDFDRSSPRDAQDPTDRAAFDAGKPDMGVGDLGMSDQGVIDQGMNDLGEVSGDTSADRCAVLRCASRQVCAAGRCECETGWGDCDMEASNGCEADLGTNAQHCGSCGRPCVGALACSAGICGPGDCRAPMVACGMRCVDLQRDERHCGACGVICGPGAPRCCIGACQVRC